MTTESKFEVSFFSSAADFLEQARADLELREDSESLMLGLAEAWVRNGSAVRAWIVRKSGRVALMAFQMPPHNLILSAAPDLLSIRFFAEAIAKRPDIDFPGIVGPVHEAQAFAEAWSEKTGRRTRTAYRQRIHRADSVRQGPRPAKGRMVVADQTRLELCMDWSQAFMMEAIPNEAMTPERLRESTEGRIRNGSLFLWESEGEIVALTGVGRPTKNGVSVNTVYSPPEFRGRGYASALVAAVTRKQLEAGKKFCVLYTDLANATSNSIYASIGYRPIADAINLQVEG